MQRLSDTQMRFTAEEIGQFKEFAKQEGLKIEYVLMNAALIALGHPAIPPSEYKYGVEYGDRNEAEFSGLRSGLREDRLADIPIG